MFVRYSARYGVVAIMFLLGSIAASHGETIDVNWISSGTFLGSPSAGTVVTTFSSSAPLDLTEFRGTYTGQGGATRTFGPFEINAAGGDKLFGNFDITNSGPIGLGMNIGSGPFTFTGGTGQFVGATGQGTMDVKTMLSDFPTNTGDVEQQWQGTITLVPVNPAGDYNQNGTVDAADYVLWRHTLGQTGPGLSADGNSNDMIDAGDYDLWRGNFGQTTGSGTAFLSAKPQPLAVPEPTTSILLVIGLTPGLFRARRRKVAFAR